MGRERTPSMPAPITQRHHCIVWSDWVTAPQDRAEPRHAPGHVVLLLASELGQQHPRGCLPGSRCRCASRDLDGTLIDVYEATTQMTDESGQNYPVHDRHAARSGHRCRGILRRLHGQCAYRFAPTHDVADAVVASAQARGVPIVSSVQMLTWLDGRNDSSFGSLAWNGSSLSFTDRAGAATQVGLQAMLPSADGEPGLDRAITRNGSPVTFGVATIKGIQYATFAGDGRQLTLRHTPPIRRRRR